MLSGKDMGVRIKCHEKREIQGVISKMDIHEDIWGSPTHTLWGPSEILYIKHSRHKGMETHPWVLMSVFNTL
jgi:hypothetical protein